MPDLKIYESLNKIQKHLWSKHNIWKFREKKKREKNILKIDNNGEERKHQVNRPRVTI